MNHVDRFRDGALACARSGTRTWLDRDSGVMWFMLDDFDKVNKVLRGHPLKPASAMVSPALLQGFVTMDAARERELLDTCKSQQGDHIPGHHGPGSWATKYRSGFVNAAADLYEMYLEYWGSSAIYELSKTFIREGIKSARHAEMKEPQVKYLVETYLVEILNERAKARKAADRAAKRAAKAAK